MKMKTKILLAAACTVAVMTGALAKEKILVNSGVTTHIVMPENIKLVDISTDRIMGTNAPTTSSASSRPCQTTPFRRTTRKTSCWAR